MRYWWKIAILPHLHSTSPSEYCHNVWYVKTRNYGGWVLKKIENRPMFTRFDTTHEDDGQTPHDSTGRTYAYSMAHNKMWLFWEASNVWLFSRCLHKTTFQVPVDNRQTDRNMFAVFWLARHCAALHCACAKWSDCRDLRPLSDFLPDTPGVVTLQWHVNKTTQGALIS